MAGIPPNDPDDFFTDEEFQALLGGYDPSADISLGSGRPSFHDEVEEEERRERERTGATQQPAEDEEAAKRREEEEERRQAEEAATSRRAEEEAAKRRADIRVGKLPAPSSPTPPPQNRTPSPDFPDFLNTPDSPPLIVPDSPHSMRRALRVAAEILSKTDEPSIFEGLRGNTEIWQSLRRSIQEQAGILDPNEQHELHEATQRSLRTREEEEMEEARQRSLREKEEQDLEAARQRSLREKLRFYEPEGAPTQSQSGRAAALPGDQQIGSPSSRAPRTSPRTSPRQPTQPSGVASTPGPAGAEEERAYELLNAARRRVAGDTEQAQQRRRKRSEIARSPDQGQDEQSLLEKLRSQFVDSMWSEKNEPASKLRMLDDVKLLKQMYEVRYTRSKKKKSDSTTSKKPVLSF
ncbi:hypothetical protein R1sor_025485 [Riccia sorocarpa]|uniref:Uncharacterized protein n=1 Tax=Riccia sorocarpa TaxID=122646 RepID=A0ABD3GAB5_9MARC